MVVVMSDEMLVVVEIVIVDVFWQKSDPEPVRRVVASRERISALGHSDFCLAHNSNTAGQTIW